MFKTINSGRMPTRGSKYSACVDLYANEDVVISAGETKLVGLGVCIDLDTLVDKEYGQIKHESYYEDYVDGFLKSHYLQLVPRSSLGKKLIIPHGVGIVDMDYRDEIMIRLHNPIQYVSKEVEFDKEDDYIEIDVLGSANDKPDIGVKYSSAFKIKKGDRIAQITLLEHKSYLFYIDTEEVRDGGFGSTDEKKPSDSKGKAK